MPFSVEIDPIMFSVKYEVGEFIRVVSAIIPLPVLPEMALRDVSGLRVKSPILAC